MTIKIFQSATALVKSHISAALSKSKFYPTQLRHAAILHPIIFSWFFDK